MLLLTSAVILVNLIFCYADYSQPNSTNCAVLRNDFGATLSNFTYCAINNSHPIRFCQDCVTNYIDVLTSFQNLSNSMDANGTMCYDPNVALDRLEIIGTMYSSSKNLWDRAKCNECFVVNNGTITPQPANITTKFYELYKNVASCIEGEAPQNSTQMCQKCLDVYMELSNYYDSVSDINEEIANCMDIVDLMNGTRTFWSDKCCRYRHHKEYIFIMSTCLMLAITLLFYSLTKLLIDKKLPVVFLQSRFAESLNHTPKR
ncbi:hypothetical protein Trydic_g12453 [Trypoxylus dichotomus]